MGMDTYFSWEVQSLILIVLVLGTTVNILTFFFLCKSYKDWDILSWRDVIFL